MENKIIDTRRPVWVKLNSKNVNGYFHRWVTQVSEQDKNETCVAIVELEDGTVKEFYTYQIQFKFPKAIVDVHSLEELQ